MTTTQLSVRSKLRRLATRGAVALGLTMAALGVTTTVAAPSAGALPCITCWYNQTSYYIGYSYGYLDGLYGHSYGFAYGGWGGGGLSNQNASEQAGYKAGYKEGAAG